MQNKLTKREQSKQNNILAIQTFKNQGYTVAQTAELLRLSKRTVYRYWDNTDYKIFNNISEVKTETEQYITKEKYINSLNIVDKTYIVLSDKKNLSISEDKKEKYSIGKLELKASTFIKKEDGYHFMDRIDTVTTVSSRTTPYLAQSLARKVTLILTDLFKDSYKATPWELSISENDFPDYASVLKEKLSILKANELKEGVYKDYYSFFTHNPEPGFSLQANDKGIVTKAVKGEEKTAIRHFYAFVYQGIAYKNIPVGYTEIFKDDNGVFIEATRAELFPETVTTGVTIGAAAGGMLGGAIGAVIDVSLSKRRKTTVGSKVYLDPFTGNYLLPEDFGKTK